ncbi:hypothetical protein I552_4475 [Mycobacterium xenopi 3993]|nr:hypothetical protein I552_4475 [Mycobacterium xenopi 3993]
MRGRRHPSAIAGGTRPSMTAVHNGLQCARQVDAVIRTRNSQ